MPATPDARAPLAFSVTQRRILASVLSVGLMLAGVVMVFGPSAPQGAGAGVVTETIFGSAQPKVGDSNDHSAVELGLRMQIMQRGRIRGVRFWKSAHNTGTHTGSLWSESGTRLATVTFTGESSSGWQEADFSSPVTVHRGTYIVSYHTQVGDYADDAGYFSGKGAGPADVQALPDGVHGSNSIYRYGTSGFPTSTWKSTNYWVDVVYQTHYDLSTTTSDPTTTASSTTSTTAPTTTAPSTTSTTMPTTTTTTGGGGGGGGTWTCGLNAAAEACYAASVGYSGTLTPVNADVKITSTSMTNLSSGALIATPSGTDATGHSVYTNFNIAGCVQIATGQVALNNSYIHSGDRCVKPAADPSDTGLALVTAGGSPSILAGGVSLTSDTLDGLNIDSSTGVARPCILTTNMVATLLDIHGCTHDIWPISNSTISYSYVHDPTYTYGVGPNHDQYMHRNNAFVAGAHDITFSHDFIKQTYCPVAVPGDGGHDWCGGATSSLFIDNHDYGGDYNITVDSNYLMGGNNADAYGGNCTAAANNGTNFCQGAAPNGIVFVNNSFAPWGYSGVGTGTQLPVAHGTCVLYFYSGSTWSNNVNAETGAQLPPAGC
jgi:hypothetical protein